MTDTRYNGWTNYATWRVNLEIWADKPWDEDETTYASTSALADYLREDTDLLLSDEFGENLRMDYARSFVSNVNWHELAEHYAEDFPGLIESDNDNEGEEE
jgi:hypothetical protein